MHLHFLSRMLSTCTAIKTLLLGYRYQKLPTDIKSGRSVLVRLRCLAALRRLLMMSGVKKALNADKYEFDLRLGLQKPREKI